MINLFSSILQLPWHQFDLLTYLKINILREPKFAEANTLTYGTRVDFENARVDLSLNVRKVFFSTYNKKELSDSFEKVSQIYPYLVKEENLWKTNLENGNPEVILVQRY